MHGALIAAYWRLEFMHDASTIFRQSSGDAAAAAAVAACGSWE